MIKHFTKNIKGRDFVVGDIHGCFSDFEKHLKEINFNPSIDRMFSVGDLIDRGPESERCVEFLETTWFHAVRGNHEDMAISYLDDHNLLWLQPQNGGDWIMDYLEEGEKFAFIEKMIKKFQELPLVIEVETQEGLVGIIHAECPVDDWLVLQTLKDNKRVHNVCLWSRELIYNNNQLKVENIYKVFHGHTVLRNPAILGNRHYIDTGLAYKSPDFTGKLTIVQL